MSNITPTTPSFVFGYWRPWQENSNLFDSYLDYVKDTSLVKYGADTIAKYIKQASKEQIKAINEAGKLIAGGLNNLSNQISNLNETFETGFNTLSSRLFDINTTIETGFDSISNQMANIDDKLSFLNRNLDVLIEQQKLNNIISQNILELLGVPDSEKERKHCIEMGIKFFVKASKDPDLFADALEELLKAESLMKQDYFVLHRIGCIYLYVEKFINPEKALDYFSRAAKYASVETDSKAEILYDLLGKDKISLDLQVRNRQTDYETELFEVTLNKVFNKLQVVMVIKELLNISLSDSKVLVESAPSLLKNNVAKSEAENLAARLKEAGADVVINNKLKGFTQLAVKDSSFNHIERLAADSYEKAAFSAYVLGKFSDAVNYQSKALKFNSNNQNRFVLAKYQIRSGELGEGVNNLSKCIDYEPIFAIATFKEIDLINEPQVIKLISEKNHQIDEQVNILLNKIKDIEGPDAEEILIELNELSKKTYETKVLKFASIQKNATIIINELHTAISEIDNFIESINSETFLYLEYNEVISELISAKKLPINKMRSIFKKINEQVKIDNEIRNKSSLMKCEIDSYIEDVRNMNFLSINISEVLDELKNAKELPYEKMEQIFSNVKIRIYNDKIRIGSKIHGGLVFYIDKSGKHGLVCTYKDIGEAVWGVNGKIEALGDGICDLSGLKNTKIIAEHEPAMGYSVINNSNTFYIDVKTPAPIAGRLCLESNFNGHNDWYLPTKNELELIFQEESVAIHFKQINYWSSTESSDTGAWCFSRSSGRSMGHRKTDLGYVIAVRAF